MTARGSHHGKRGSTVGLYLSDELVEKLEAHKEDTGERPSSLVSRLLEKFFSREAAA